MVGKKYDVEADITVNPKDSSRRVQELHARVTALGNSIKGTTSLTGGLIGQVIALGGAYVGFNAITAAFRAVTGSAIAYQSELQRSKIAIATVLSAVQNVSYETAAKTGDTVFSQLRDDAIKSVATTKELFQVYTSIVGPIAQAGFGLDKVRKLTNDSVSAASVLGIDLQQTSRDMQMILRGAAGVDVKLFSTLKSVGAITESTEDWNKKLSQAQRVEKLEAALGKFAPAATRFETSWAGVTSTFKDVYENLRSAGAAPVFEVLAKSIASVNNALIANREKLSAHLADIGKRMGSRLDVMFLRARNSLQGVANHWDEIVARIRHVADRVQAMAPVLLKAAVAWQAINTARNVVGTGIQAVGAITQATSLLGSAFAPTAMAANAAATGGLAAGGGSVAAGAATAGTGAAVATFGAAAAALAVLTGAVLVAQEQWQNLQTIFSSATSGLGGELILLAKTIWTAVVPVLKMFAQGPMLLLAGAFTLLMPVVKASVVALRLIFETLGVITNAIYTGLKPGFDIMWDAIAGFAKKIKALFGGAFGMLNAPEQQSSARGISRPYDMRKDFEPFNASKPTGFSMFPESAYSPATPAVRTTTVNDFRGSKIEVRQDFREADPDRVLVQMFDAIGKSADYRTQSSYLPSLAGS